MESLGSSSVLQQEVNALYGEREGEATSALGRMGRYDDVLFMVKQGGPVTKEDIAVVTLGSHFQTRIIDARDLVQTRRKKSEWTGFHAETMIVSAMLAFLSVDARETSIDTAKELFEVNGPTSICANAPCCKHCAALLDALGVSYDSTSGKPGKTGWWNPFTDAVYGHGTLAFQSDIPGSS